MTQVTVWVYILECADGSYYVGKYQGGDLEVRVSEHNTRKYPNAYTAKRLPVRLVWSEWFSRYDDAVAFERQLKGWSRAKKDALIRGDEAALKQMSRRGFRPSTLRDAPLHSEEPPQGGVSKGGAPQGEGLVCGNSEKRTK